MSGQRSGLRRSQSAFLSEQPHSGPAEQRGCSTVPDQREKADLELFQLSFVYVKRQNEEQGGWEGGGNLVCLLARWHHSAVTLPPHPRRRSEDLGA